MKAFFSNMYRGTSILKHIIEELTSHGRSIDEQKLYKRSALRNESSAKEVQCSGRQWKYVGNG
jgi:hypothetical protein